MLINLKVCPPLEEEYNIIKNKIEAESVKEEVVADGWNLIEERFWKE